MSIILDRTYKVYSVKSQCLKKIVPRLPLLYKKIIIIHSFILFVSADCGLGESPSHAQTSGSRGHGDILYFKCPQGYQLIGPSMVTCKNGAWSEAYPNCVQDNMV